jgi:hypothetical protein
MCPHDDLGFEQLGVTPTILLFVLLGVSGTS